MSLFQLFKRTSTKAIQSWEIEVEGNRFRTITGQEDGAKVTSAWTTCKGKNTGKKNATTDEEQAIAEATAKRDLKLKKGYFEDKAKVDKPRFLTPMLAEEYDPERLQKPLCLELQPKLDGIRCIFTKEGAFSREGNPIEVVPHIAKRLAPLFEKDPTLEFDGELYNHKYKDNFDKIVSLVRKTNLASKKKKVVEEILKEAEEAIQYWIYDIRGPGGFKARINKLVQLLRTDNVLPLVYVPTYSCDSFQVMEELYKRFLEEGFEGMMVRQDLPYEFKRTYSLMKRKPMKTKEFLALDVLEGKGNKKGYAAKILVQVADGITSEISMKGDRKFCADFLKNKKKVIGKMVTSEFQGYTPKGRLRFGRFISVRDYE